MTQAIPASAQAMAAAKASLGEANFMESAISAIKWGESFDTCVVSTMMKVATYVLTFLVALALTLTLVGIPLVMKGISEYNRQTAVEALENANYDGIVDAQIQGLQAQIAANQVALGQLQGRLDTATGNLATVTGERDAARLENGQIKAGLANMHIDVEPFLRKAQSAPATPGRTDGKDNKEAKA